MRHRRWSKTEDAANEPAAPVRAELRGARRAHWPALARLLVALPLLAGLLSVPVSCALAAGPHSLFVSPDRSPAFIIHIHGHLTGASQGVVVAARNVVVCPTPAKARPLPDPVTSVSALVAVMASEPVTEPAPSPAVAILTIVTPRGIDPALHAPPPRG